MTQWPRLRRCAEIVCGGCHWVGQCVWAQCSCSALRSGPRLHPDQTITRSRWKLQYPFFVCTQLSPSWEISVVTNSTASLMWWEKSPDQSLPSIHGANTAGSQSYIRQVDFVTCTSTARDRCSKVMLTHIVPCRLGCPPEPCISAQSNTSP